MIVSIQYFRYSIWINYAGMYSTTHNKNTKEHRILSYPFEATVIDPWNLHVC